VLEQGRVSAGRSQSLDDVVVVGHDKAHDLVDLPLATEKDTVLAPDQLQPLAGHDEVGADHDAGDEAVELAQEHDLVAVVGARQETVELSQAGLQHGRRLQGRMLLR
jgi:hypothetical protein